MVICKTKGCTAMVPYGELCKRCGRAALAILLLMATACAYWDGPMPACNNRFDYGDITLCTGTIEDMRWAWGLMWASQDETIVHVGGVPRYKTAPRYYVFMREDLEGWRYVHVLRHEFCHVRQAREGRGYSEKECQKAERLPTDQSG